jgi:hypothetical protein
MGHSKTGSRMPLSLMSKITLGKQSTVSRRSKAVPLESLFKTDVESVKSKNERKVSLGEKSDTKMFGRWKETGKYQNGDS